MRMPVMLESPYAGDIATNTTYARRALLDSLNRGEAPFASHLLYTQVLDDNDPVERNIGLACGREWLKWCDKVVVYTDYGISKGMSVAIALAEESDIEVEHRKIGMNP